LENFASMRELLQSHELTHLGQCDPFEATVDAALFVARKRSADFQSAVSPTSSRQDAASPGAAGGLETRDTADLKSVLACFGFFAKSPANARLYWSQLGSGV
jgi:hypothetical protein